MKCDGYSGGQRPVVASLRWSDCTLYIRYYLGRRPVVVIADPDMLRQVMVRDFSSFPNRMVRIWTKAKHVHYTCLLFRHKLQFMMCYVNGHVCLHSSAIQTIRFATKPMTDCLLMLRNERWKRVRSILTPSFSAAKMKEVSQECLGFLGYKWESANISDISSS